MKMKHKVLFLLVLYIGSMLLLPSTLGLPIAEETQVIEDFTLSAGEAWLEGWNYRKQINLNAAGSAGTNYQVKFDVNYGSGSDSGISVYCDSKCVTDFSDIRFTDNDGNTALDYYIREYTDSGDAEVWVEVADDLGSNQIIFMYYGNTTAVSTTSNGTSTFIFFDDFEDNDLDEWDNYGCSISSSTVHTGTYSAYIPNDGSYIIGYIGNITHGLMLHVELKTNNAYRGTQVRVASYDYNDPSIVARLYETSTSRVYYYSSGYTAWTNSTDIYNSATWYKYEIGFDQGYAGGAGTPKMRLFMEDSYIGEEDHVETDGTQYETENIDQIRLVGQNNYYGYMDDVWVRRWDKHEPGVSAYGPEESNADWQDITTASFVVWLDMSEATRWAFESWIVFIGMAMIPLGPIYLVYAGKEELSIEKIFFALVIFCMGWALLIGGIMP
jgi:hypothetical protein